MRRLTGEELREEYLRFFEELGHLRVPSSSLIPHGDPTLLLTTAGMVQMKPYFMGEAAPPRARMTSAQKCFRTTDIDEVGDATHLTFFEMLGNFSVGDYFKREAISFAWDFCTRRLEIPPERLWTTVFLNDDEAASYWRSVGVPEERVRRFDEKDNWWGPAGDSGPCGPCSEIHYDRRPGQPCDRLTCGPNCECGRFLEIWNLVFMEFNQDKTGVRTPLLRKNIDTGMGLERTAAVLQGASSVYDTDLFRPFVGRVEELSGQVYGRDVETDRALRVVAEHSRAVAFLLADGVSPGNEGRGYVLRRVLRRAIRFGLRLHMEGPFLERAVETVLDRMGQVYSELVEHRDHILATVAREQERFQETLAVGTALLEEAITETLARGQRAISSSDAFRLYDTYGFPVEMAEEVAAERGLTVDRKGFQQEMDAQRGRARAATHMGVTAQLSEAYAQLRSLASSFVGYEATNAQSHVTGLIVGGGVAVTASAGQEVELITGVTPFYPEGGGQVGDSGTISGPRGWLRVWDTQRPVAESLEFVVHRGVVEEGSIGLGDSVSLEVDAQRRQNSARHHTATHLLHAALRQVLGAHVRQAGSLVAPDHLRFDFSHNLSLSWVESEAVQKLVNERVRLNGRVSWETVPFREALARGALAFFGEKYGERVRVVEIEGGGLSFSLELCGGVHVERTGEVGLVKIVSEGSVGSGMRRIEAVAGAAAEEHVYRRMATVDRIAAMLRVPTDDVESRIEALLQEYERLRKQTETLESEMARARAESLLSRTEQVGGVSLLAAQVEASGAAALREMADVLRARMGSGVILLGTVASGRPLLLCAVTPDLVGRGYHAGRLVREIAPMIGGGGGGRAELAEAGGKDPSRLGEALAAARGLLKKA